MELTIADIWDGEYGCEELPEGAEPMVTLYLTDAQGRTRTVRLPDRLTRGWRTGDRVTLAPDGSIRKTGG